MDIPKNLTEAECHNDVLQMVDDDTGIFWGEITDIERYYHEMYNHEMYNHEMVNHESIRQEKRVNESYVNIDHTQLLSNSMVCGDASSIQLTSSINTPQNVMPSKVTSLIKCHKNDCSLIRSDTLSPFLSLNASQKESLKLLNLSLKTDRHFTPPLAVNRDPFSPLSMNTMNTPRDGIAKRIKLTDKKCRNLSSHMSPDPFSPSTLIMKGYRKESINSLINEYSPRHSSLQLLPEQFLINSSGETIDSELLDESNRIDTQ